MRNRGLLLSRLRDEIASEEYAIFDDGSTSIRIPDPISVEECNESGSGGGAEMKTNGQSAFDILENSLDHL